MRRVLPVVLLAVLAVALTLGCSRQPKYHVGEWESRFLVPSGHPGSMYYFIWVFLDDGICQRIAGYDSLAPEELKEGTYKIDYSKTPIQISIYFKGDNAFNYGIVRFIGEDKSKLQFRFDLSGKNRPTNFDNVDIHLYTKKMKM